MPKPGVVAPVPVRPRLAARAPHEIGGLLAAVLRVLAAEPAAAWLTCRDAVDRITKQVDGCGRKRAYYWLRRAVSYQFAERGSTTSRPR